MRGDCFFAMNRENPAFMRVTGCNRPLQPIEMDAAKAPTPMGRAELLEVGEARLVEAKKTRNDAMFMACLDLIEWCEGHMLMSSTAARRIEIHLGVWVPHGPYAHFAMPA